MKVTKKLILCVPMPYGLDISIRFQDDCKQIINH